LTNQVSVTNNYQLRTIKFNKVMSTSTATKSPVMLYTEQTPNPESLKFVTNRMLFQGTADFREEELAK